MAEAIWERPAPKPVDDLDVSFWGHVAEQRLCFQRCSCGVWRHPPRHRCAACGSSEWAWVESAGRGRVFSWTVTHQPMHPAFAERVPYAAVVVELDEGVRIVADVEDLAVDQLELDLQVEVVFAPAAQGARVPVFRPTITG